jgi:hypothetical protein
VDRAARGRRSYHNPYLNINSVVKQCGKTRLLEVLQLLVNKPWYTGRVSPPAWSGK